MDNRKVPARKDGRVIIHFDYDCFYASVFEAKNPSLKSLPFAVQQKQIIVTCNYEARRRGLHKLQLIREARRICPDVIIELGEDISRFRDASKELYTFVKKYSWNGRVERLGFDEVWMDVTDMVDYNLDVLNRNDLPHAFFQTSKDDPTCGFDFDATVVAGHIWPKDYQSPSEIDELTLRLRLGSHLALYMRHQLEDKQGYTSTVGIATNKVLSKLVGNCNKPKGQTTLMPPFSFGDGRTGSAIDFMDEHDIGKVPGIGFKLAQKIRAFVLNRPPSFDHGLIYGGTRENVTVADVRNNPTVNPESLEKLLSGPGSPHGIGFKIWCLLHGNDDTEVSQAKAVPSQISIEDSYIRLDTMTEVLRELTALAKSLLTRMRIDLLGDEEVFTESKDDLADTENGDKDLSTAGKKWLAHPKTLRLTTRPRQPLQPDGTRARSFKRISHSAPLPQFVFGLSESIEALADRMVREALVSMFRKLHPEKSGWNLSLVNLAVTNMAEAAGESKTANGRDIGTMFKRQEDVLRDFRVVDFDDIVEDGHTSAATPHSLRRESSEEPQLHANGTWNDGHESEEVEGRSEQCHTCGVQLPAFAMVAHQRFHSSHT